MSKLLLVIFIISLISCDNKSDKINKVLIKEKVENIYKVKKDTIYNKLSLLHRELNVQNIKSQFDNVTTSFISKEKTSFYRDRIKNKYYGQYIFHVRDKKNNLLNKVGRLIIYDSINPYLYEKNTDEFVEITLEKRGVSIYNDSLRIGMNEKELIDILGTKFDKLNETLIFSSANKKGFFKIKDSLVAKIKIGIYRDSINIDNLLKKSYW